MLLEGSGEATAAVSPIAAFAFLADPHHASEWFAGAGFAVPPTGPVREGLTWSFEQTPGTRHIVPMRMTIYEPPRRFAWASQASRYLTNHIWELRCEPAMPGAPEPGAILTSESESEQTRLVMTISLQPGLVDMLSTAAGYVLVRRALREQAQRAVTRAAEALETRATRQQSSVKGSRPNPSNGKSRRKGKRR